MQFVNCQINGGVPLGAVYTCVSCYNGSFTPLNATCH
jgi:hypothetical protein